MKLLVQFLALATSVVVATAAERRYMAPVDAELSLLSVAPGLQAYHLAAREALVGPREGRTWEAIVFPSFQREWAVYVETLGSSGDQRIVCTRMQTQLWYQMESVAERDFRLPYAERQIAAHQKADKSVAHSDAPVGPSTAAALERLWSAMLSQARPVDPPTCLDGVSYFLFEVDAGVRGRGGWSRCPQDGTAPSRGLKVLEELCGTGSDPEKGTLTDRITRLQRSLEQGKPVERRNGWQR